MQITNSPDISLLEVKATFDLSGVLPLVSIQNMSVGSNLGGLTWWFTLYSPANSPIHIGSSGTPDVTGAWTIQTITKPWPRPFNQIEWSGAPYTLHVFVKDSAGTINTIVKTANISRPLGNTELSKSINGVADIYVKTACEEARIYFEDRTNTSYKGLLGVRVSSVLKVIYPIDETNSVPAPFTITDFSNVAVPISYSSDNYQFSAHSVYEYHLGDNVYVRIKYVHVESFPVLCNIDLCPLAGHIVRLVDDIENGSVNEVEDANRKLLLINSKFALVVMGKLEPLCGVNVPKLINEIIDIGGFPAGCCDGPTGIIPQSASVIDGYNFQIVSNGGDINGTITKTGSTVKFNLGDKVYVFAVAGTTTGAVTIVPTLSPDGFTKTYTLNINLGTFATDLYNTIKANPAILNQWNTLFGGSTSGLKLAVDGKCIFKSTSTDNYTFTLKNIPANTTYALFTGMKVGGVNIPLNFSFNLANLAALQTYLNAAGLGTFVVSVPTPNPQSAVIITSTANAKSLESLAYKISETAYVADYAKSSAGYIEISAHEVIQNVIDFICKMDDTKIVTSKEYKVCTLNASGDKQEVAIAAGSTLAVLISKLIELQCDQITFSAGATGSGTVSCESLKALFTVSVTPIDAKDYLFGTKGGACSRLGFADAFNFMLTSAKTNATTLALFCELVALCGAGKPCAPYNYFNVTMTEYSTTCTPIVGIDYTLTG